MFPPVIKWLLGINLLLYLLGNFVPVSGPQGEAMVLNAYLQEFGALWPIGSERFAVWQYFTYMFLHGGFFHIFINMLILWMFGMEIEQIWGSKRFLIFYILAGLGAGLIHSLVTMSDDIGAPTVGASGAIMGVMIAFGTMFPDRIVFLGFFFPLKAKYAVLLIIAIDLFAGISDQGDNIAHFAHLGGALTGYILLKTGLHGKIASRLGDTSTPDLGSPSERTTSPPFGRSRSGQNVIDVRYRDVPDRRREPSRKYDFGDDQERIDEILDKISMHGYQSLTSEEKEILTEASKKIG